MKQLTTLEASYADAPRTADKLVLLSPEELKELLTRKKDNYDLHRQQYGMLSQKLEILSMAKG